ncbi:N-acetylglucosamine kinase [Hymenobacter coccineus]|uniref:N-acetylglucosamine kinase n=1 Tax=Hymenobacter coccineus TaxID=1908235 RepID=A0A1G1TLS5_9BACT|nr:N-acetylglucosamine kinase [Hymenobacter coccineus]OGX91791.1 N-acetylglucosamine kinase [Hymenobacter coccineus]
MILIADGGSTKTTWCLVDAQGTRAFFNTEGYNPEFISTAGIMASLRQNLPAALVTGDVAEVHYYGASVVSATQVATVADAMGAVFGQARVSVGHDLLAAARALLGRVPGFAAILGTGTNSCIYDGARITHNVDSLGYFLGDEGSGAFIGKRLLRDYLRGLLPADLAEAFRAAYGLDRDEILDRLYNQPFPNRFVASFAKFASDHGDTSYCRALIAEVFEAFFQNIITKYPDYQSQTFNCVGSVAYHFRDALAQAAATHGMAVGKIIRSPIDDLVSYHLATAR